MIVAIMIAGSISGYFAGMALFWLIMAATFGKPDNSGRGWLDNEERRLMVGLWMFTQFYWLPICAATLVIKLMDKISPPLEFDFTKPAGQPSLYSWMPAKPSDCPYSPEYCQANCNHPEKDYNYSRDEDKCNHLMP